jgi:putative two-component system response regulator
MTLVEPLPPAVTEDPPTVLIVDDEPELCDVLTRRLTADGFRCRAAANAEAAWRVLQQQSVDAVTCDVQLPGTSGTQLLRRIAARYPDTAVLMLTGCKQTSTAVDALTHGACSYMLKPVAHQELTAQVRQALRQVRARREQRRHTAELERRVLEQTRALRSAHEETIHRLVAASSYRDEETGAHICRTGLLSEALARAVGWSQFDCDLLRMAAPMHDVGKIGIPDRILRKPGRLTPEEFEVMKRHTVIGAEMLQGSSSPILQLACRIALNHHERWDGTGYPNGIAGESIPLAARILTIVDVYDALSHDRIYRPAFPEAQVCDMLRQGAATHFDPTLTDCFFSILDEIKHLTADHPDNVEKNIDGLAPGALGPNDARETG